MPRPLTQPPPGTPPPSKIQTNPRLVHIASKEVQPTMRLYLQDEDTILCAGLANFNNVQVNFLFRMLTPDGQITPTVKSVVLPTAGVLFTSSLFPMGEGFLLSAEVECVNPLTTGQWVFIECTLVRGGIQNQNVFDQFLSGYVAHNFGPSWPDWIPQRPTDGPGTPVSVSVGNPAAGLDWS